MAEYVNLDDDEEETVCCDCGLDAGKNCWDKFIVCCGAVCVCCLLYIE